ncbi:DUF2946 family protein [Undibacterium parvum]|uniref:DUF2946 family protein n=1 Tax=Undibacterium parvum TaxID=401471 RepID=A0A3S9HFW0_9BURK|nr:DUF2946 family protein [Undibacterium parvum]AZP10989.1 DUF2946 family protein [Undibacterium parvum]
MDEIVLAAIAKWPDVPHCYGWLGLDARGNWRMRDERAQALQLAGDKIRNPTLLGFINRNYQHDQDGCWYFQNGPQRVYVDLESAPYIVNTTPDGLILHTAVALPAIDAAFMSSSGQLYLRAGEILAQLDDRDLATCLPQVQLDAKPVSDEDLMTWLELGAKESADANQSRASILLTSGLPPHTAVRYPLVRAELNQLMHSAGYIQHPKVKPV